MINRRLHKRAFTIVELLVVVSIIAMLSSVVLVALQGARDKGRVGGGLKFSTYNYRAFGADAIARYDFNELTGTAGVGTSGTVVATVKDYSGNGYDLTCTADAYKAATTPGTSGFSIYFDASSCNKTISTAQPTLSNSWTVSGWFQPVSSGQSMALIQVLNPSSHRIVNMYMFDTGSGYQVQCGHNPGTGEQYAQVAGNISLNKWYNIVCTYNSTTQLHSIYIDGKLAIKSSTAIPANPVKTINTIALGNIPLVGSNFIGYIDDVAIYTQSLAASDIQKIYAQGLPTHLAEK